MRTPAPSVANSTTLLPSSMRTCAASAASIAISVARALQVPRHLRTLPLRQRLVQARRHLGLGRRRRLQHRHVFVEQRAVGAARRLLRARDLGEAPGLVPLPPALEVEHDVHCVREEHGWLLRAVLWERDKCGRAPLLQDCFALWASPAAIRRRREAV